MGRVMGDDQPFAYRVRITETTVDGPNCPGRHQRGAPRVCTSVAGPFSTAGAATAAVTRATRRAEYRSQSGWELITVAATYERCPLVWEVIG